MRATTIFVAIAAALTSTVAALPAPQTNGLGGILGSTLGSVTGNLNGMLATHWTCLASPVD